MLTNFFHAANTWAVTLLGQAAEPVNDAARASEPAGTSVWEYAVMGGPMMVPIGLCSLVALTIVAERLVSLRRSAIIPPKLLSDVEKKLDGADADRSQALDRCKQDGSPIAEILATGVRRLDEPIELLEKHVSEAGERAVHGMRKYLRFLAVIASVTPLMGLLGTIFGMINAFQTVAVSGEALGKTELLAKGIYQAMISTAGGLLVAIPVLLAYHWISAKIDHLVVEMDRITVDFIERHAGKPAVAAPESDDSVIEASSDGNGDGRIEADAGRAASIVAAG